MDATVRAVLVIVQDIYCTRTVHPLHACDRLGFYAEIQIFFWDSVGQLSRTCVNQDSVGPSYIFVHFNGGISELLFLFPGHI